MNPKKVLVVYYSRSGTTRTVAQAIAHSLKCDIEEIHSSVEMHGKLGYLRALAAALRGKVAPIEPVSRDLSAYQLIIIGTPVWAASVSSPIRAFLDKGGPRLPEVAFFCTLGGHGAGRTFRQMRELCAKPPITVCAITAQEVATKHFRSLVAEFTRELRSYSWPPQHHSSDEAVVGAAG